MCNTQVVRSTIKLDILSQKAKILQGKEDMCNITEEESCSPSETMRFSTYTTEDTTISNENHAKMKDEFEPINIKGQEQTGIWVHHPGSEVCQTWEPRKARIRTPILEKTQIHIEANGESPRSSLLGSRGSDSSNDESVDMGKNPKHSKIKKGLGKISNMFHKLSPKKDDVKERWCEETPLTTPRPNLLALGEKKISVNIVLDQDLKGQTEEYNNNNNNLDSEEPRRENQMEMETESVSKHHLRHKAKEMAKHAGTSVLRKLSGKGLYKHEEHLLGKNEEVDESRRSSNAGNEVTKENPFVVGGSPIRVQEGASSSKGDVLLDKTEVP